MTPATAGRSRRFCPWCCRWTALPIHYAMPCRPPTREVWVGRGSLWVYEVDGSSWVNGGCRAWPFPPGVRAWVRAMWERHVSGWSPPSYAHACLRCGRRFGVFRQDPEWYRQEAS